MSITSGVQSNAAAKASADMQETAAQAAADAQQAAAQAQAQQLADQASIEGMKADIEARKAGIAQEKGEIEQRRRMLQLSYDIGKAYTQWAGNGLLVDGGQDSLGSIVTADTREAAQDVEIMKTNTANAVWEHQMNQAMYNKSAASLLSQSEASVSIGEANANATVLSGEAQAYATRQAGLTALYQGWGSGISSLGAWAGGGIGAFSSVGSSVSSSLNNAQILKAGYGVP